MKTSDIFFRLTNLSRNLWWSWQPDAQNLFASLDPQLWHATNHSPPKTIRMLAPERREAIARDEDFEKRLSACEREVKEYLRAKTWFEKTNKPRDRNAKIAYFCAEFAVHESLPQYSGGLGVLAGDHLKSTSDLGIPLVAIGLLYRAGYYTQSFAADGSTRVTYPQIDFADLPIHDTGRIIAVPMSRATINAKIWRQDVGRVSMYLLDCDIPQNKATKDRELTRHLYGGDREYRIRQEILLGVGGVIALDAMGIKPTVYHLNEGHAAFATLERLSRLIARGADFESAREAVRNSTIFTTHTPVPAGNDRFEPKLAIKYLDRYANALSISRAELLALGRENPDDAQEEFCMTILALKLARFCNGVAALHGDTSRRMWMKVYGATRSDQVPIGHVTNGVHPQTWLAPELRPLYDKYIKPDWRGAIWRSNPWKAASKVPAAELWKARNMLRARMIQFVRQRLIEHIIRRGGSIEELIAAHETLDPSALTIGFARRFATYKRAPLIFKNAKRLAAILGNPDKPVQLVFAGKAHPKDLGGQEFAQMIFRHAHASAFRGKVVLLEDYDMHVGRMLTSGCDVWLNNPLRPQEASGTSGMKPPLHGGLNCSILDGWWPEAFDSRNGWAIGGKQFDDHKKQDAFDADAIYSLLETKLVPAFFDRGRAGIPQKWVAMMRRSMQTVCAQFSTHRMVSEYLGKYYLPAHRLGEG